MPRLSPALLLILGCADKAPLDAPRDSSAAPDDTAADTSSDDTAALPACGTAGAALPDGLEEIAWDSDRGGFTIEDVSWSLDGRTPMRRQELWEAVRFELDRPAKIYGFSVMWGQLPEGEATDELAAGLYPDFGYNGMDFWAAVPLWQGTRCLGELTEGAWETWAPPSPVEVAHPGLVYVAHHRDGHGDAAWTMDEDYASDGTCAAWDDCHSAVNGPTVDEEHTFNGTSAQIPYDFRVRLAVAYTAEPLATEALLFRPTGAVAPDQRVAWGDYDDDGDEDLLVKGPELWRNDGGRFTDVTDESGLGALGVHGSGAWADYDNDGCLDLVLFVEGTRQADSLLHSECDGSFTDATATSGLTDLVTEDFCEEDPAQDRDSTAAAAWWDLDADGLVDLYFSELTCWADERDYVDRVWHNLGGGRFEEWTGLYGFSDERRTGRGAAPIDADQDGDIDLLAHNYSLQANFYFDNQGDGAVLERGDASGLAGERTVGDDRIAYYGHTLGAAWGDLDNDGDFDVVLANLAHPRFYDVSDKTQVLLQGETGFWEDIQGDWSTPAGEAGLRYQETHTVPVLGDLDQDGDLDLMISARYDGRPTDLYWGDGDGTFTLDAWHAGVEVEDGWAMALADFDQDGDLDLAAQGGLFENQRSEAEKGHWVQVRLIGDAGANRAAIGAVVRLTDSLGVSRLRQVAGSTGQGDQDAFTLHFGLGEADGITRVEVMFPGGSTTVFEEPLAADQRYWLWQSGGVEAGWAAPAGLRAR